jgi:hypothetical protein
MYYSKFIYRCVISTIREKNQNNNFTNVIAILQYTIQTFLDLIETITYMFKYSTVLLYSFNLSNCFVRNWIDIVDHI